MVVLQSFAKYVHKTLPYLLISQFLFLRSVSLDNWVLSCTFKFILQQKNNHTTLYNIHTFKKQIQYWSIPQVKFWQWHTQFYIYHETNTDNIMTLNWQSNEQYHNCGWRCNTQENGSSENKTWDFPFCLIKIEKNQINKTIYYSSREMR